MLCFVLFVVFFFKQKTAYEMRISDWSSDVCSSDLVDQVLGLRPGGALLKALTIGATSDLRDADWDAFRRTGTTHLIAISGFNLALVAGFAFFVLRWGWSCWPRATLWLPAQRFALIGSALLATFYALLAGFEPPVARALFILVGQRGSAACRESVCLSGEVSVLVCDLKKK